jgi:hypothetical protein
MLKAFLKSILRSPIPEPRWTLRAAEGVCHDFDPPWATNTKILSVEGLRDLVLGPYAKAFSY